LTHVCVISKEQVETLFSMKDAIKAVERCFAAYSDGKTGMPPIVTCYVKNYGGVLEIKSGYLETDCIGAKVICYFEENPSRYGLPALTGVVVLNDLKTGIPIAIVNAAPITALRTGAAGAVAAKYLARRDSRSVGIVGTGVQGRYQLIGLNELFDIAEVRAYDRIKDSSMRYASEMSSKLGLDVKAVEVPRDAVENADIVVTATPSRKPIINSKWVRSGTHINAIGADEPGKQELDPQILTRAKIVVDCLEECKVRGEINSAMSEGIIDLCNIYAELGDIVAGKKKGRESASEITIFDATGMAIQDLATSYEIYKIAKEKGIGTTVAI